MIFFKHIVLLSLVIFFECGSSAFADCHWQGDNSTKQAMLDVGDLYVPRDAPIGSVIGTRDATVNCSYNAKLICSGEGTYNQFLLMGEQGPNIIVPGITVGPGAIMKTNIPGIGAIVKMLPERYPSSKWNQTGNYPYLPATVTLFSSDSAPQYSYNTFYVTLIKIGRIPSGQHPFNRLLLSNAIATGVGLFQQLYLQGSVTQSECTLPDAPAHQLEVAMGTWEQRVFNGKGSVTPAQPFDITLHSCIAGTYPTGQPWNYFQSSTAHVRFEGAKGSLLLDPTNGVLGLTSDSTATGLAIQILKKDGTPLALGVETPIMPVQDGVTVLALAARYIQTTSALTPSAGSANGAVHFTITYR